MSPDPSNATRPSGTSRTVYHRAVTGDVAIEELRRGAREGRFRADLVNTFVETLQSAA